MYYMPQTLFTALTFFSLASCLHIRTPDDNQGRAALCFSGQFRSFNTTVYSAQKILISAFSKPDVFLFLNLLDAGKGGGVNHAAWGHKDVDNTLEVLQPKGVQYYSKSDPDAFILDNRLAQGSTCYQAKGTPRCCHWSWHAHQFWTIHKCFEMVKEYETNEHFRYKWFVRARPDTHYHPKLRVAIDKLMRSPPDDGTNHAWLKKGPMSDTFALLGRDAADVYGDMAMKFIGDSCTHLPGEDQCEPSGAIPMSTECFVYRNLLSGRVNVHWDGDLSSKIVRKFDWNPWSRLGG